MSCCGNRRAAARLAPTVFASTVDRSASRQIVERLIPLRYSHEADIMVRGSNTGRVYRFETGRSVPVCASDARSLLAFGQFVIADAEPA